MTFHLQCTGAVSRLLPCLALAAVAWLPTADAALAGTACRGLGLEKVKAGDQHCGLASRKRKAAALEAACNLAEVNREELEARAKSRAQDKCRKPADAEEYRCSEELHRWENVYTNVISVRCWAECGWAYLIDCEKVEPEDKGSAR